MIRIFQSSAGTERLAVARAFVNACPPAAEIVLIGGARDAVDEFAREAAQASGAAFGLHRFTMWSLAVRLAAPELAQRGLTPAAPLAVHAVAARSAFEARRPAALTYLTPVADGPGFAAALASTLSELRDAGVDAAALSRLPDPGPDLAVLANEFHTQLCGAGLADHAVVLDTATRLLADGRGHWLRDRPAVLLDVPIHSTAERRFVAALANNLGPVLATVPAGDDDTLAALSPQGPEAADEPAVPAGSSSLARLHRHLFSSEPPPEAAADDAVCFLSAPGEGRECVEIARRLLDEAGRGVPFDDMAVLLRAPEVYASLLENALRRAAVPAYFAGGTTRPDASGRALLALLACRAEGLSANRFAEYLSLGEVPDPAEIAANTAAASVWATKGPHEHSLAPAPAGYDRPPDAVVEADAAVVAGGLRAPWRWESLLVDGAVVGGRHRWVRRLDGLAAELRLRLAETRRLEADSPRVAALERELGELGRLRGFALPVIEVLDALPEAAAWGQWLAALDRLALMALRRPERVAAVLAELQPMAAIGPVALDEVRAVLAERLSALEHPPPTSRYGRVFIATPAHARARSFAIVFVPGLAERTFPQRPREDPLLLDALRRQLNAGLATQTDRGRHERLLLRLAVGAARHRVYLSYPRIDVAQARPRVPSFYALDIVRAVRGRIPDFEALEREAASASQARLAWPAPPDPCRSIDAIEHDLAVLGPLIRQSDATAVSGRARYLLELNPHLARSLRSRWYRWQASAWGPADGLVAPPDIVVSILAGHRLGTRPYSPSALERFAACPYQFLLAAIHGLEPRKLQPPVERLDPLTRGSLFHRVQADVFRELQDAAALPLTAATLPTALAVLDAAVDRAAAQARDALAPPILRVWEDEIDALRADLRLWLQRIAGTMQEWEPDRCEWRFGLPEGDGPDPLHHAEAVRIEGGTQLRGAVDLIERRPDGQALRVTDHKTGANRTKPGLVVGGGETLQPVLYGLAVEAALGTPVSEARLFFCTAAGGFSERVVRMDAAARRLGTSVLALIDRALTHGFLPPAPRREACVRCDFREVCGPYEETRAAKKDQRPLAELHAMRAWP